MAAVIQRPLRGSRISTFYPVKSLPSLASLDSAFQLQEYISLLIRLDVHDVDAIVSLPGTPSKDNSEKEKDDQVEDLKEGPKDTDKSKNEVAVDEACWIYEQLRRLAQDLSHPLITTLQQECTRASCPEMKAGEWLYLCVAHGNDGAMEQCCAIDYILHTVDSATALLNSPRTFPSRLQIPPTSHRHFSSLARRLGRIFAHAYFHHREAFEQAEAESSLYARFLALTAKFDLVPAEFLVIPSSQFTHEDSGPSRERDSSPRILGGNRQHYSPQPRQEDHQRSLMVLAPKHLQQHQLGLDRSRSPKPLAVAESTGSGSPSNSGIGELPTTISRSRFGRNRTDTMVFNDAEANAVADELAAKAKAGELEPDFEPEDPKTARPVGGGKAAKEEEDMEIETDETHFEILLSPGKDISAPFEQETTGVPTVLEVKEAKEEVKEPVKPVESEVEPEAETPAAKAEELEKEPVIPDGPPVAAEKPEELPLEALPTEIKAPDPVEAKLIPEPTLKLASPSPLPPVEPAEPELEMEVPSVPKPEEKEELKPSTEPPAVPTPVEEVKAPAEPEVSPPPPVAPSQSTSEIPSEPVPVPEPVTESIAAPAPPPADSPSPALAKEAEQPAVETVKEEESAPNVEAVPATVEPSSTKSEEEGEVKPVAEAAEAVSAEHPPAIPTSEAAAAPKDPKDDEVVPKAPDA